MDPPGNARSLPTYCPTCQHLCSRQDDHLAPTEVTLWASHRAKLVAASQWQLWPVETANCSLPSFQSKTRIRCIHLSGFNSLSAAWIEENIKEALFRLVVCGGFPNPRLGSSCIRWWGSGKVQLRNIPALLLHCVALICVSEVLETVQLWQWGIWSAQMVICFSGESCSPYRAQGKTTTKKREK